jgi:hypothetical protein
VHLPPQVLAQVTKGAVACRKLFGATDARAMPYHFALHG